MIDQKVLTNWAALKFAIDFRTLEADWLFLPHETLRWCDWLLAGWHSAFETSWAIAVAECENILVLAWF